MNQQTVTDTFDDRANSYDAALAHGLAVTGEGKEYYARGRVARIAYRMNQFALPVRNVLDYGCGVGSTCRHLDEVLGAEHILGVDVSQKSIAVAKTMYAGNACVRFALIDNYRPDSTFDLAYCNGVFHHIQPDDRYACLRYIWSSLRPGAVFAFCENNPWNLGTQWVMRRTDFDRDALPIPLPTARRLLVSVDFELISLDNLFFFPRILRCLRSTEHFLYTVPLGGQYCILARKPL